MNRRIPAIVFRDLALAFLSACGNGIRQPPDTSTGALTVQMVQPPPALSLPAGTTRDLWPHVLNDNKNGEVTWSCTPAGACGTLHSDDNWLPDRNALHRSGLVVRPEP